MSDEGATLVAGEVYRCLSIGKGLDYAVQSARRLLEDRYHPWPLLRLFGDEAAIVPLVEAGLSKKRFNPVRLKHKTLTDSNVRVLESGFVGRRRYVQRGVGVLRGTPGQCELKCGLLVRGPAGIGKSCLVGKLVERFKDRELIVFHGVVREADVIPKLRGVLDKLGNSDGLVLLKSDRQYEDKIKGLFRTVFKDDISAIIYFDDFEQNLIRHGNEYYVADDFEQNLIRHGNEYYVADAVKDIIRPFLEAVEWTEGNSNVVITSRYQFILECDGKNLSTEKLVDITIMSFDGADLNKKKEALEFIAKSNNSDLYLKYGGGNPRLLEWLNVIAGDEGNYDLAGIEAALQLRKDEFIHEYLAGVIANTAGEGFHKFIRKATVYGEPVGRTAFESFGGEEFLDTGVDLTLIEREVRDEFVYWVTPVIRDAMWGKLTPEERLEMHGHAFQWYDSWIAASREPNYKYMEEAVRHALEVGNIRGACPHAEKLGQYFKRMVLYREGRAIMEKIAVKLSDKVIDEAKANKDKNVCGFLGTYALTLRNLGELKQAIEYHEKALAIRLKVYGDKHPDIAASYRNLADVFAKSGDPQKAAEYTAKAEAAWP
ncbi:MAG: ATP-binding protein [Nitrospirae bacterium]|nr:ATP-binding protein [Nitrospirota bacterium]